MNNLNLKSLVILMLVLLIFSPSCKKDILYTPVAKGSAPITGIAMESIDFTNFNSAVKLSRLGALGKRLSESSPGNRLQSLIEDNSLGAVAVYTDSIKKFTDSTGINYVFKMALSSPKASSFRNLTVFVSNEGNMSAFIATYTPKKEWIESFKKDKNSSFDGDISVSPLNLQSTKLTSLQFTNTSEKSVKLMSTGSRNMLVEDVCFNYRVFEIVQVRCNGQNGHSWAEREECPIWHGVEPGVPPYTYLVDEIRTQCYTIDWGDGGGTGGGGGSNGGGGTYPTPPREYDPCGGSNGGGGTGGNQAVIGGEKGLRLQLLPANPCDKNPVGGGSGTPSGLNYAQKQQAIAITNQAISYVLEDVPIDITITSEQRNALSQVMVDLFENDYYNNLNSFPIISNSTNYDDPEHPFLTLIKNHIRRVLGIDQPKTAQEAEEVVLIHGQLKRVGSDIDAVHNQLNKVLYFVPGYAALDALIAEGNYTSAAINLSFDLFGGRLIKGLTGPIFKIAEKYSYKTIDLAIKYPNIANALRSFSIREFDIIKRSASNKVIVVGEDMANRIIPSTTIFNKVFQNAETFTASYLAEQDLLLKKIALGRNLTPLELKSTLMYTENMNWIKSKLTQGYNIIDIGPKIPNTIQSAFYEMERSFIYVK